MKIIKSAVERKSDFYHLSAKNGTGISRKIICVYIYNIAVQRNRLSQRIDSSVNPSVLKRKKAFKCPKALTAIFLSHIIFLLHIIVPEELEIELVGVVELLPELGRERVHVRLDERGRLGRDQRREVQRGRRSDLPQHVLGVLLQRLVLADDVVLDEARVAQLHVRRPVLVHALRALVALLDQVRDELCEGDAVARLRDVLHGVPLAELLQDLDAVPALEVGRRRRVDDQLVPVGGDEALHGVAHEQELGVRSEFVMEQRALEGEPETIVRDGKKDVIKAVATRVKIVKRNTLSWCRGNEE